MEPEDLYSSLHARTDVVHEAIKSMAHDAACRCHVSRHEEWLEGRLRQVSWEVTEAARRIKELAED